MTFILERSEYGRWMRSTTSILKLFRCSGLTASVYSYSLFDKINFELDKLSICIWPIDRNERISIWMKVS